MTHQGKVVWSNQSPVISSPVVFSPVVFSPAVFLPAVLSIFCSHCPC